MQVAPDIQVVLVEDDAEVRAAAAQSLRLAGIEVKAFASVEQARSAVTPGARVVVVSDVRLPGASGNEWLRELQAIDAGLPVVLITGYADIAMAVQAIREGAYDFIEKPCSPEHLVTTVRRAAERRHLALEVQALRDQLDDWHGIQSVLIGRSTQMQRVRRTVLLLASTPADVLIYGETGTGKELVARCLHVHSERRRSNFVPVNCGGLSESLAETELFGHEVGAFTGASRLRIGKIEHANGGTLFLDEIESMPLSVQVKFLRALQERSIERIGSNKPIVVDCRVVAASKEDLKLLGEQARFRRDLYYRIGVAFIELPPLRERREDIALLFEHFTLLAARRYERGAPALTHAQLAELIAYPWPGNVRELRNTADRFVLGLCGDGLTGPQRHPAAGLGLHAQMDDFERALVAETLLRHAGNVAATARELRIPKPTLYDKLRRFRLDAEAFQGPPTEAK